MWSDLMVSKHWTTLMAKIEGEYINVQISAGTKKGSRKGQLTDPTAEQYYL